MMKVAKKVMSLAIASLFSFSLLSFSTAHASTETPPGLEQKNIHDTTAVNKTFEKLNELRNNGATMEDAKAFLEKHGILVKSVKTQKLDFHTGEDIDNGSIAPHLAGVDPSYVTVNNWIDTSRDGSQYYIYAELSRSQDHEDAPGDYDILSLDWDKSKLDYTSHAESNSSLIWLNKAYYSKGTVVFNVKDNWYTTSNYISGWVITDRIASGKALTEETYHHSWDVPSTSSSAGITFTAADTGGVGFNYTINWTTTQKTWTKSDTSYVYIP